MEPTIYHNPRCAKSRETLRIIEESGYAPHIVEYLKETPGVEELDRLCTLLGVEPVDIVRRGESRLEEIGVSTQDQLSRAAWLEILAQNPILIQRPIVVMGEKAVIGRPPENVREIL